MIEAMKDEAPAVLETPRGATRKELTAVQVDYTASPPRHTHDDRRTWALMTDEEITRWLAMYHRRRLLADEEIPAAVRAETVAFLDYLIAQGAHEQQRRIRAGERPTPPRFTPAFVADLKQRIALDTLCEEELGAQLGRLSGGKRQGPCPLCRGGSNCFTVYLADQSDQHYYCFRCGAGGDAISAIMQTYGDTFPQAVERLCQYGHLPLPDPRAAERAVLATLPGRMAD